MTVAELLAKSTPAEQAVVSAIQARAAAEATARLPVIRPDDPPPMPAWVPDLEPYQEEPEPVADDAEPDAEFELPRSSNRLAKTIIVTVIAIAAAGVATAAGAIGGDPPPRLAPSSPTVQPAALTGSTVVRPSLIKEALLSGTVAPRSSVEPPVPWQVLPGDLADRTQAEQLVLEFYNSLPLHADDAFALLSPEMQGEGQSAFEADWRAASYVEPKLLPSGDDAVLVAVSVSGATEVEVLRLVVRVEVKAVLIGGIAQMRITGAELLSAHRG